LDRHYKEKKILKSSKKEEGEKEKGKLTGGTVKAREFGGNKSPHLHTPSRKSQKGEGLAKREKRARGGL